MAHEPWITNRHVRLKPCRYGPMLYVAGDQYIGRSLDRYGEFSQGEMELLGQLVRPGQVVLDVGANVGTHTIFLAQAVGPTGTVHAFEPQRLLFQMLCGNVALNALANVRAHPYAVGRAPGTVRVPVLDYQQAGNYGGLSVAGQPQGEAVTLVVLDQFAFNACHLVKIDVEGMESDVIAGAQETIQRLRPTLYLENDREDRSAALIEQLLGLGYRLYWHLPPLFNPDNHFGVAENLFPGIISANMLGIHGSVPQNVALREIRSPDDGWRQP